MKIPFVSIFKPKARDGKQSPYKLALAIRPNVRPVISASTDKQVTVELAMKLSAIIQRVRAGLSPDDEVFAAIGRQKPLRQHIAEWARSMRRQGRTRKHVEQYIAYTKAALEGCETMRDVTLSKVSDNIGRLECSGATKNRHVAAVRSMLAWGTIPGNRRWDASLLADIKPKKWKHQRKPRRILTMDQLANLIATAEQGKTLYHLSGRERALVYRLTLAAGLRANEVRTLTVADLGDAGIRVRDEIDKARRGQFINIPKELMADLFAQAKGKSKTDRLFELSDNLSHMIRLDLKRAGIPFETAEGRFVFHSLRHQCGAMLASSGKVPLKAVQQHMRHKSSKMTLDTYGHLFDRDKDRPLEAMDLIGQRLAQRAAFFKSRSGSLKFAEKDSEMQKNQWSDGESNPDLLNAIHATDCYLVLHRNELRKKQGAKVAPRAAQRLLRQQFSRVTRRQKGGTR